MSKTQVWLVRTILLLCALLALILNGGPASADSPEVPVVDAGLGSCRADFTVKDGSDKPLYNAKISLTIRYGFLNKRKSEVEVGTNSDGKARVTGLPNLPKRPLDFLIKSGDLSATVTDDQGTLEFNVRVHRRSLLARANSSMRITSSAYSGVTASAARPKIVSRTFA